MIIYNKYIYTYTHIYRERGLYLYIIWTLHFDSYQLKNSIIGQGKQMRWAHIMQGSGTESLRTNQFGLLNVLPSLQFLIN